MALYLNDWLTVAFIVTASFALIFQVSSCFYWKGYREAHKETRSMIKRVEEQNEIKVEVNPKTIDDLFAKGSHGSPMEKPFAVGIKG